MTSKITVAAFAGLIVALGSVAVAHHSTAAYLEKTIVLRNATVMKLVWANPHCFLSFQVKDPRGAVTTWNAEGGSPSGLSRVGWTRNSVKAGDVVTVELFPARNGTHIGRLARVIFPDNRELLDSLYKGSPFEIIQKK